MAIDNKIIEQSIIGCLLIDQNYVKDVLVELKHPNYFSNPINKAIFNEILGMFSSGSKIDFATVLNNLVVEGKTKEELKDFMVDMLEVVPNLYMLKEYVKIIKEEYKKRMLSSFCSKVVNGEFKEKKYDEIIKDFDSLSYRLLNDKKRSEIVKIKDIIFELLDDLDTKEAKGFSTGFEKLDRYINGLNKSDLVLLAARPGVGKTAFALNIARNVSKGHKTLFFSLEMSKLQLMQRLVCMESDLLLSKMRERNFNKWDWKKVLDGADSLQDLNLFVDDTSFITISDIRAKAILCQDIELIVIDYLQLISSEKKFSNRVSEVSEMTRRLKVLAKELDIPILCLSQLSRASEQRTDHRPMLSDLRDSGSIEQDADIVLMLYRKSMYEDKKFADEDESCDCIIAKNRHGETGTCVLKFDPQFSKFQ